MDIEPMSMAEHDIFLTFQPHALQRLGSIGLHPALQHWWHCGDRLADELSNLWILKSRKKMCIYIYIYNKNTTTAPLKSKSIHLFLLELCPTLDHFNVISLPIRHVNAPPQPPEGSSKHPPTTSRRSSSGKIDHSH